MSPRRPLPRCDDVPQKIAGGCVLLLGYAMLVRTHPHAAVFRRVAERASWRVNALTWVLSTASALD